MHRRLRDVTAYDTDDVTYQDGMCNYTSPSGNRTHEINLQSERQCGEWVVGNAAVWCFAAFLLAAAWCMCPNDPNRHGLWLFVVLFGVPSLALAGNLLFNIELAFSVFNTKSFFKKAEKVT